MNEKLRDRLVCGIANEKCQQCLVEEDGRPYNKAQKFLLSLESAEKGIKDLAGDSAKKVQHFQCKKTQNNSQQKPGDREAQLYKHGGGSHDSSKCHFRNAECH